MPRSRSIFIQSERVLRRSPLALTWPARLMAPPNSSSFSVSVVLPASGWEMMANVRRRATSSASGERDGDSAVRARSDMAGAFGRETSVNQGYMVIAERKGQPHIRRREGRPSRSRHQPRGRPCLIRRVVMAWTILLVAGLMEVGWAIGLKYTEGFTKLIPSV